MSRRLVNITLDNIEDLPARCRRCVFWELDPETERPAAAACVRPDPGHRARGAGVKDEPQRGKRDGKRDKESWISGVLLDWGSCGKIAYVDGVPAGYVMYAPPVHVPRSAAFPTGPVSGDAVLLMTGYILAEFGGGGLGRMLIQATAKDLIRRRVKAVEAFGAHRKDMHSCVLPVGYLHAVGFTTVCPHPEYPRLRLDLKTVLSWRDDVEAAIERLLRALTPSPPDPAPHPV